MTPLLAISVSATITALLLWPAPASALHELPCGSFSETVVDPVTGRQRCVELSPEVRSVLQRSRQLQLQQERRFRALAAQQRQRTGPERGVRDLATQQQQRDRQQTLIETVELARQQQIVRELIRDALLPALTLEQSINQLHNLNRIEVDETRRRALVRANELRRRQNAVEQQVNLPTVELESELRVRRRQLERQQQP